MTIEIATEISDEIVSAINYLIPQLTENAECISRQTVEDIIAAESTFLFIARDVNKSIIGTLTLVLFTIPTSKKAFVEDVVVDNKAQGLGAGRKLIEAAIAFSGSKKITRIELSSNPARTAANALYKKMGFEVRETNFYRLQL